MGEPTIKWLELAISPRWRDEGAAAAVHPLRLGEDHSCFGITLDERWLCSSEGALTVFNSEAAATRFLGLLNVTGPTLGGDRNYKAPTPDAHQCFRLDSKGLTVCGKCRVGDHAAAPAAAEDTHWDERW